MKSVRTRTAEETEEKTHRVEQDNIVTEESDSHAAQRTHTHLHTYKVYEQMMSMKKIVRDLLRKALRTKMKRVNEHAMPRQSDRRKTNIVK